MRTEEGPEIGTKIGFYKQWVGNTGHLCYEDIKIGYCKEPVGLVFERLYKKYVIRSFEGLLFPVDGYHGNGIKIASMRPPIGCTITGSIDNLQEKLKAAEHIPGLIRKRIKNKSSYFVTKLRYSILEVLGRDFVNYRANTSEALSSSGERLNQRVRDYRTLLTVAGIVMGCKSPDAKLLQQIINQEVP